MANIRTIQYLGSKLNVKDEISEIIKSISNEDSVIVDGFAGTGVVGNELKKDYKVIANDVQRYSWLINKVLLNKNLNTIISNYSINDKIINNENYISNKKKLMKIFSRQLEEERVIIKEKDLIKLSDFTSRQLYYDGSNYLAEISNSDSSHFHEIYSSVLDLFTEEKINELRGKSNLYMLFTLYYLNGYFSLNQCIEIDSIRFAISKMENEEEREFSLLLLLHAVSEVTCSVGKQFAQPIKLLDNSGKVKRKSAERCLRDWKLDVFDEMNDFINRLSMLKGKSKYKNEVYNLDIEELLVKLESRSNLIYYLDPPYTIDHYSRFYHVLEVLIDYNYPELERKRLRGRLRVLNGRYPVGRFQSPLSIPSKAKSTFNSIFKSISVSKSKLVLSYSEATSEGRGRVVTKDDIIEGLEQHFDKVEIYEINHSYRKLNKEEVNVKSKSTRELVFIGENNG